MKILIKRQINLQFPPRSTRLNDLEIYEKVTRSSGPAMTWSMFAINYLDLNVSTKADEHFENGFRKYLQPPFLIWREVAIHERSEESDRKTESSSSRSSAAAEEEEEEAGAVNFLTGAGGFLQSILYGYCGVRVLSDRLEINEPRLLPSTNELIITGIKYRGLSIDLIVRRRNDRYGNSLRFRCDGQDQVIGLSLGAGGGGGIKTDCSSSGDRQSEWCEYERL